MATAQELQQVVTTLAPVTSQISMCAEVGAALIDVEQPLMSGMFGHGRSDYDRAREQLLRSLRVGLIELDLVRRTTFSGDLIRASAALERIRRCCERCPVANQAAGKGGTPFQCLVSKEQAGSSLVQLRLNLDSQGAIRER